MNKYLKQLRIAAKRLLLTYPQFNSTRESVREQLFQNLEHYLPFKYCISKEYHKDGNTHFHVYLEAQKKFNLRNAHKVFNLKDNNGIIKSGDYQPVKRSSNVILRYITKEDNNPLTNINFDKETGTSLSTKERTIQVYKERGYQAALSYFRCNATNMELATKTASIARNLNALQKIDEQQETISFIPLNMTELQTQKTGQQMLDWANNQSHLKTLYIHGDSGIGKTEGLKTFIAFLVKGLINKLGFIRHPENLKDYNLKELNHIIFDDLPISKIFHKKGEDLIWFTDITNKSPIKLLYKTETMYGIKKSITSNKSLNIQLDEAKITHPKQREAIKRRIYEIDATNQKFPLVFPTEKNINEIKNNPEIYHPNKLELEIEINIKIKGKFKS